MTGFTEQQRAELRDAAARSRLDAERISQAYVARQARVQAAILRGQLIAARDVVGLLAENVTALERAVADLDDDELSRATFDARQAVTRAGNRLARKFPRNTTSARLDSFDGNDEAGAGRTHHA